MSLIRPSLISTLVFAFSAASAFASQTRFDCDTVEDGTQVRMVFTILNINDPKTITAKDIGPEGSMQTPIAFWYKKPGGVRWQYPKDPYNFIRAAALNGGDSDGFFIGKDSAGRKFLGRDVGDDCVSAELVLYANTGYSRGYLRSQNHCGDAGDKSYSKVACEVR